MTAPRAGSSPSEVSPPKRSPWEALLLHRVTSPLLIYIPSTTHRLLSMMKPIRHVPHFRLSTTVHSLSPTTIFHPAQLAFFAKTLSTSNPSTSNPTTTPPSSSSSSSKRRAVTPFNDTGQVPWSSLSLPEKAGRAVQQSFNMSVILMGAVLTCSVGYFLFSDVFSPDSKTAYFNRAVDRVRADARCTAVLGPGDQILAHGDETYNKWRRARPLTYGSSF